jgi:alpha-amylase
MKKVYTVILALALLPMLSMAQGWPSNYQGVMLQGFYWNSFNASKWSNLQSQTDELSQYFNLVWIPQSASCGGTSMGYDDLYWFTNYNSSFGTETELRSLISTFKNKGIGTIADVVINHRKNVSSWVDFPAETYNGTTYQLQSTDICANDDDGATKTWATANGYSLSTNNDTGEGWSGMRDLDHNSTNVQTNVKAYLNMLLNDFGYAGFRYDMVKGYSGSFTGIYNSYAKPTYSVGEYWDGTASTVINWLNATKVNNTIQSAAFDFPFRYTVRDAINNSNWAALANTSVMSNANYRQYAVTFVENHDTEKRSDSAQDPIKKDTLAANAFMLAMPGTPCVFFKHWIDCKQDIKAMIDVRKAAGISNTSTYSNFRKSTNYLCNDVVGSNCDLLVAVGNVASMSEPSSNSWTKILSGYHYAYYLANSAELAWADKASGSYEKSVDVTLTAVSNSTGAKVVYTTDGTEPTASNGTQVASGTKISLTSSTTLKVGLLTAGTVKKVITRNYNITVTPDFTPTTATVYVRADWSPTYFYAWDDNGTLLAGWPGTKITDTKVIGGVTWYYHSFSISKSGYSFNIIFDKGSSAAQTVDITGLSSDKYYILSTGLDSNGKYTVTDVSGTYTGISTSTVSIDGKPTKVYTIDGRLIRTLPAGTSISDATESLPKGIYIINHKKIAK